MQSEAKCATGNFTQRQIHIFVATVLAALVICATGPAALAQDKVGIYWDTAFSQEATLVNTVPGFATGYVVVKDPVAVAGILAWELCVALDGNADFTSWEVAGSGVNFESPPCFIVGYSEPILPAADGLLLATFQVLITDIRPVALSLQPIRTPSLPGQMAYVPADSPNDLLPLVSVTGAPEVAWINRDNTWLELDRTSLFFDVQPIGSQAVKTFTVTNAGGGVLNLDIGLPADCTGFSLTGGEGPVSLGAGASVTVEVTFSPLAIESYICGVELASGLPTVTVHGTGREPIFDYTVSSVRLFGEVGVGGTKTLTAAITNTGEVPIPVAPVLADCGNNYTIVSGAEPAVVAPSTMHLVDIQFLPQTADTLTCALIFADGLDPVELHGIGTVPVLSFLLPAEVNFSSRQVGTFTDRTVTIINNGEATFTITPALDACGSDFAIISGGNPVELTAGQEHGIVVRFQPTSVGSVACILTLGNILPDVQLVGLGTVPLPSWNVTPTAVVFPVTPEGTASVASVRVDNTGVIAIDLDVQLVDIGVGFSVVDGGGLIQLLPGTGHDITLGFQPVVPDWSATELDLGSTVPAVPVSGFSGAEVDSCEVSVSSLDFGTILVGRTVPRTFQITNTGNQVLVADPATSSLSFAVTGGPVELQPGQSALFTATFSPVAVGTWTGVIETGNQFCLEVTCIGQAIRPAADGENLVGVFFDPALTYNETQAAPYTPTTGYVALINPSDPSGVSAWECAFNLIGDGIFLSWTLEGTAVNFATPPEFIVGIGPTPLPGAQAVLLARFDFLVLNTNSVVLFEMGPVNTPSLPGDMAWIAGIDSGILPMTTTTGEAIVARVNDSVLVGIEVPSPLLRLQGGQVHLTWPAPVDPGSGNHVYRRVAGELAERLTSEPIRSGVGSLEFIDRPVGFAPGTTLYYSYAVVADGVEKARSPEVEVTLSAVPASLTRLLTNVPNPFNPQTEIRFELAQPGEVRVAIYDVTGRLVKDLESSHLGAGPHSRVWQGRDSSGRPVSSGAYYVRLTTIGKVDHQKILLLK